MNLMARSKATQYTQKFSTRQIKKTPTRARKDKGEALASPLKFGAGEESRTLDLNLGKVALYQLSYSREATNYIAKVAFVKFAFQCSGFLAKS
jgi:hypothetical protein